MLKKFLVLCVMLSSLVLWSEEKNASDVVEKKLPRNILSEMAQGMPVPENIVELSKIALENELRYPCAYAVFLSLYYLGFPKEIAGKFNIHYFRNENMLLVPNVKPLIKRGKIRDLEKAIYYANKATDSIKYVQIDFLPVFKYGESLLFEKFGDEKEIEDFFIELKSSEKESYESLETNYKSLGTKSYFNEIKKSRNSDAKLKNRWYDSDYHYYSYMFYKGYGGFEKNLEKAKYYAKITPASFWANFYTGYALPLDPEFAIFLLESINSDVSKQILSPVSHIE